MLYGGRFRYSDLKEAAPEDYGICFSMRRSLSFALWCFCCRYASVSVAGGRENGRRPARRRVWSVQAGCIVRNARHRTSVRAEARERFEAVDVDSCCAPAGMRRRSEEELGDGEPLDKLHGSAAERTVPA
jgi:hypothetical protein